MVVELQNRLSLPELFCQPVSPEDSPRQTLQITCNANRLYYEFRPVRGWEPSRGLSASRSGSVSDPSGERQHDEDERDQKWKDRRYQHGSDSRSFNLPGVDEVQISQQEHEGGGDEHAPVQSAGECRQ